MFSSSISSTRKLKKNRKKYGTQLINQNIHQAINQWSDQSINQSTYTSSVKSMVKSINQSITYSLNQAWNNESINQSIKASIGWSTYSCWAESPAANAARAVLRGAISSSSTSYPALLATFLSCKDFAAQTTPRNPRRRRKYSHPTGWCPVSSRYEERNSSPDRKKSSNPHAALFGKISGFLKKIYTLNLRLK